MGMPSVLHIRKPLLEFLSDKEYHSLDECVNEIGKRFQVTEEEKQERYHGKTKRKIFRKLVTHVVSEFRIAGIIEDETEPGGASFKISKTGIEELKKGHEEITKKDLRQYGGYVLSDKSDIADQDKISDEKTPEEVIDESEIAYENHVQLELLERIKIRCTNSGFERLCLTLFEKMGYGESQHTGKSGDRGVDGIISEDKLGLKKIYVQAKKHDGTVPFDHVTNFAGKCVRDKVLGIFVTTSDFSKNTKDEMERESSIKLINGTQLTKLLYEYNIGIELRKSIDFKEINIDEIDGFN